MSHGTDAPAGTTYQAIDVAGENETVDLFTFPVSGPCLVGICLYGNLSGVSATWDWEGVEPLDGFPGIPQLDNVTGNAAFPVTAEAGAKVTLSVPDGPFELTGYTTIMPMRVLT